MDSARPKALVGRRETNKGDKLRRIKEAAELYSFPTVMTIRRRARLLFAPTWRSVRCSLRGQQTRLAVSGCQR